jgi:hypothetical protein
MLNSQNNFLLLSPNFRLIDSNTILTSNMTSQFMTVNFPFHSFLLPVFTFDSFIHGGECHRPWHTGGKHA